ncbi:MAG: hypothetical protein ACUVXF_10500 [Desulfobaccales bacterium]
MAFPVVLGLVELLRRQGRVVEAREAVGKVLLFQPDHREALALQEQLANPAGPAPSNTGKAAKRD